MELHIYRVRVTRGKQADLFDQEFRPEALVREAVLCRPTTRPKRRTVWHIGNIQALDETALYFRIGRLSSLRVPVYDEKSRDFVEQIFQRAPFAHGILDWQRELVGIAKQPALAPTSASVAKRFEELLNAATLSESHGVRFCVTSVTNPEQLLEVLRTAYSITSFRYSIRKPNPWDADGDFVKPFERLVEAAGGEKGNVAVSGHDLETEPLERITRSAAATGDDVRVRLRRDEREPLVTRSLRGDTASVPVGELESEGEQREALRRLREALDQIRGDES